jgi:hypothetical protein
MYLLLCCVKTQVTDLCIGLLQQWIECRIAGDLHREWLILREGRAAFDGRVWFVNPCNLRVGREVIQHEPSPRPVSHANALCRVTHIPLHRHGRNRYSAERGGTLAPSTSILTHSATGSNIRVCCIRKGRTLPRTAGGGPLCQVQEIGTPSGTSRNTRKLHQRRAAESQTRTYSSSRRSKTYSVCASGHRPVSRTYRPAHWHRRLNNRLQLCCSNIVYPGS